MIGTLAALCALVMGPNTQSVKITVQAEDDIWVYPHASDPGKDLFLRVWGNGRSIPGAGDDVQNFSFGYLSYSLKQATLLDGKLKSATLVLYQAANGTYTDAHTKEFPLEIRQLPKPFTEKSWSYDLIDSMKPLDGKEAIFATTKLPSAKSELPIRVEVDLLALPPGKKAVEAALKSNSIAFALTSGIDPSDGRASYKFYSREAEEKYRPVLILEMSL